MNEQLKKRLAIEKKNKEKMLKWFPQLTEQSGIYILHRQDERGLKFAYIGQAKHLLTRLAQHLSGYQHIDLSLKKRGLYTEENPNGWSCIAFACKESELDEQEKLFIQSYAEQGWQLLNKTAGGQGKGKTQIAEYRQVKTYRDGVQQGKLSLARDLKHIMDKHLTINLKESKKGNKTSQKALQKFMDMLDESTYKE